MRFRKFDLNLLVALDVLLEEQSVTGAAERLHLTQPALSGVLSRLRDHFGDDLLAPLGRKMVLTERGKALREPLHEFLQNARLLIDSEASFDPLESGRRFSIVASDVVMLVLMPKVIAHMAKAAPGVSIEMFEARGDHLFDDLRHGDVDLLIIPERYASDDLPRETLYEDKLSCIAWEGNTRIGENLTDENYTQLKHLAMNFGRAQTTAVIGEVHEAAKIHPESAALVPFFSLLPDLIIGTEHLTMIPHRLASLRARFLPLRVFEPPFPTPPIPEVMQWSPHQHGDLGLAWLRKALADVAAELTT